MVVDLKPYRAMKDSGVSWLGQVPEHWEVRRLKYILREQDSRSASGHEQLLRVSQYTGVTQRTRPDGLDEPDTRAESLVGYKSVGPDELVVNIMLAWNGSMGVSRFHGIASPAYCVYRFEENVQPWFFHYLLRSAIYKARIKAVSTGVVESRLRLYSVDLYRLEGLLPPLPEQVAIVRFLDHADRRIRHYIRAKQKLIKLLEEQKQAIVHGAVTRGVDPNVGFKASGLQWLGHVPKHWDVIRLKQVATVQTGITLGKSYGAVTLVERPYLRVANVQAGRLDLGRITRIRLPAPEADGATLRFGDVLMTEGGDIDKLGRGCVWSEEIPSCVHQNHIFAVRPAPSALLPEFLVALLGSPHGRRYFQLTAKQTTNLAATNSTTLGNFPLRLPPVNEQQQILKNIAGSTGALDQTIDRAYREISLLHEYRTRLITDVVTGKLDVREVARQLPDEPEESEQLDEADMLAEGASEAEVDDSDVTANEAEVTGA